MNAAGWLATVVLDAAFAILTAATIARWSAASVAVAERVRLTSLVQRTAAVALAAAAVDLVLRSLAMADAPLAAAAAVVPAVLAHSHVGHAWLVGAASIALLWATADRRPAYALAALAAWAASRAAVSHAGANGLGWLVAVQVLHLLAMGAWVGSVWMAATGLGREGAEALDGAATERLSRLSTWALVIVVATGVVSAWRHVDSVAAVWAGSDAYLVWLRTKLCCVAGAVALGAVNRWVMLPRLRSGWRDAGRHDAVWTRRFMRLLRIESVLLMAALAAAARLASTEPPNRAQDAAGVPIDTVAQTVRVPTTCTGGRVRTAIGACTTLPLTRTRGRSTMRRTGGIAATVIDGSKAAIRVKVDRAIAAAKQAARRGSWRSGAKTWSDMANSVSLVLLGRFRQCGHETEGWNAQRRELHHASTTGSAWRPSRHRAHERSRRRDRLGSAAGRLICRGNGFEPR